MAARRAELTERFLTRVERETTDQGRTLENVFGRDDEATTHLAAQFRAHTVEKRYLAFVRGRPAWTTHTVDAPLGPDPGRDGSQRVDPQGKPAVTHVTVVETGTVEAARVCELERFAQVHHLTSTVTGRLRDGLDAFDLLHACFPGGSITGAPKLRAIEILDKLEPVRRHVYTGAIGWMGWNGDADWNVAIRTATATSQSLVFAAGGGITADSDPEAEYVESHDKAEGMRKAFSEVLGEITLANGGGDGA